MNARGFLWSDAWILLAIGYAAEYKSGTLADVIGMADGIQHAIPTLEELNGAIGRLTRAGFMEPPVGGAFRVTAAGAALIAQAEDGRRAVLDVQAELGRLLGAAPWSADHDPSEAQAGEADSVSEEQRTAACHAHSALLRGGRRRV